MISSWMQWLMCLHLCWMGQLLTTCALKKNLVILSECKRTALWMLPILLFSYNLPNLTLTTVNQRSMNSSSTRSKNTLKIVKILSRATKRVSSTIWSRKVRIWRIEQHLTKCNWRVRKLNLIYARNRLKQSNLLRIKKLLISSKEPSSLNRSVSLWSSILQSTSQIKRLWMKAKTRSKKLLNSFKKSSMLTIQEYLWR